MTRSVLSLNQDRQRHWTRNALRSHSFRKGSRRNKNTWLFSSWEGMRYADNSRYLFEYVCSEHPEIECYWQTKCEDLYRSLVKKNIPVQLIETEEAKKAQLHAGVCICTHGIDDFGFDPEIFGSTVVFLGHGPIAKKCWRAQLDPNRLCATARFLSDCKWRYFNYLKANVYLACSPYERDRLKEALLISSKTPFIMSGLPRNDALVNRYPMVEVFYRSFLESHPSLRGKRLILYMPTFRREKDEIVTSSLASLGRNPEFAKVMADNNAVLVCKLHYLANIENIPETASLVVARDEDVLDTQKLLADGDMLVTDFSSVAIDFALTRRPTGYYYPDGVRRSGETPMLEEFFEAASVNCALNEASFVEMLRADLGGTGLGVVQSKRLNSVFNLSDKRLGHFCEDTFAGIRELTNQK